MAPPHILDTVVNGARTQTCARARSVSAFSTHLRTARDGDGATAMATAMATAAKRGYASPDLTMRALASSGSLFSGLSGSFDAASLSIMRRILGATKNSAAETTSAEMMRK
jgi:hypothetical protein